MTAATLNIQTVAPYVLTTDSGARAFKTVTTILTDAAAADICKNLNDDFARDLAAAYRNRTLTHNRRVWLHAKANDTLSRAQHALNNPQPADRAGRAATAYTTASAVRPNRPNFQGIYNLFATAKANLRAKAEEKAANARAKGRTAPNPDSAGNNLKIRLSVENQGLAVKWASVNGRNKGWLYVTDGGDYENGLYFGKISPEGDFVTGKDCTAAIIEILTAFDANPVAFACEFGRRTNTCCFCGRHLTDDKEGRSVEVGYGPICADTFGLPWG
jgi:hypothetical protein